jgi:translocation and assembly module TamB
MTRSMKILRNVAIGLVALVVLVTAAGVLVVHTKWFRNYVRENIIAATEEGTGGRVEIGSFSFDWTHLSVAVTNFVIHGNEPASSPPYLSAARVEVRVRLLPNYNGCR